MLQPMAGFDQGRWSRQSIDVQLDEGLCLALVHEFCTAVALSQYPRLQNLFAANPTPGVHRIFSFQRGFNYVSDSLNRGLGYGAFFQNDEGLTNNMLTRDARRENVTVTRLIQTGVAALAANQINVNVAQGDALVLGVWGVDNGENWGHVVGIGWRADKANPWYFDPNQGLFRETTPAHTGTNVVNDQVAYWTAPAITDFVVYHYT